MKRSELVARRVVVRRMERSGLEGSDLDIQRKVVVRRMESSC